MKAFKNDKERLAFLNERREEDGWYLWYEDLDLGRRMLRFDLEDCAIIVEEIDKTYFWPEEHLGKIERWYIITDWEAPFEDGTASRTMCLAKLREAGRK